MELFEAISTKINYWVYIVIMMIGLFAMISKNNLIKKLIGMSIFQTAIILFYVSIGVKEGATIPILHHDQVHAAHGDSDHHEADTSHGEHGAVESHGTDIHINPDDFTNPLVHVLMLTAIVVGVSTLGVGLAITQKLHREFGSIEEHEILETIKSGK
jgi:multicomponent Na+:H+ antiporter subunit C|tara:strand:- start:436 stop:906 length:471 start_codon:yes stop_codon:yes gene_type:complete